MYAKIFGKLNAASKENMMWFQPAQVPDGFGVGIPLLSHIGFTTPPGSSTITSSTHVLNEHDYCCELGPGICAENGEPVEGMTKKCLNWHQKKFSMRTEDAKRLGVPMFLSEFGACMGSAACVTEIN